ncbi:unnamed protein product [Chrysoparadoxa australica]
MPTLGVARDDLFQSLGKTYTQEQFDELCFEFGIELDDVVEEVCGLECSQLIEGEPEGGACKTVYKIDIPANRYDLLCMEGLVRALNIFLGKEQPPIFKLTSPASKLQMTVKSSTEQVRPFVVCTVLRGIKFDAKNYASFIDLQDKLHQNICRRRTLVAIGTHDLDTLEPPFTYEALPPQDIQFVPLTPSDKGPFKGKDLLDHYNTSKECKHLKPYTGIIYDSPVYPVIKDANGVVCSLPPVINGHHSRIQLSTTNVFIECTATDETKADVVLDTVVAMFSQYCAQPFTAEPVDIIYEATKREVQTPLLSSRCAKADVKEICSYIGVDLEAQEICSLCEKMQLGELSGAELIVEQAINGEVQVTVPCTRSDVLHAVDIIEDVAIAYGYNNLDKRIPQTQTTGAPLPLNNFSDLLRDDIGRAGFHEMLTHGLCSTDDNYKLLRLEMVPGEAVSLSNPANVEYEIVRTSLLPGALKTLQHNRSISMKNGVRLFEVSDVVKRDNTSDTGATNHRHLVALYAGMTAGFEVIHGLVDRVFQLCQIAAADTYAGSSVKTSGTSRGGPWREGWEYYIEPEQCPTYFEGRCAKVNR